MMKKILAVATAGLLAVTASVGTTSRAEAFWPLWGIALAAGAVGLATGAVIAHDQATADNSTVSAVPASDHVTACQARYHSYRVSSDTFLGSDGHRHPCLL